MKSLLFLVFLPFAMVQGGTTELRWSSNTPLTWENFSGVIDETSPHDAWTHAGFRYEYNWNETEGGITWTIRAHSFFDPAKSWVKKNRKSVGLLAHEQLHFHIAELHCRYFKEKVANFPFTSSMAEEIESIYTDVMAQLQQAQLEYDTETDHYKNKEAQPAWNEFVAEELARMDKYKISLVSSAAKN